MTEAPATETPSGIVETTQTPPPTEEPVTESQTDEEPTSEGPATEESTGEPYEITRTEITLGADWKYAEFSVIHTGHAVLYQTNHSNGIVIGVNAGHGTRGGGSQKTYCHPDMSPKVTGGTTEKGAIQGVAVSSGMTFKDGTSERDVNYALACILRDRLLEEGFDVLMLRDGDDVQLDNIARTVICNYLADCHIAIHWDSDSKDYDKGAFYMSVPDGIKYLPNVAAHWEESERLGDALIRGLKYEGGKIFGGGAMDQDLSQTAFSSIPSVVIEMGN